MNTRCQRVAATVAAMIAATVVVYYI